MLISSRADNICLPSLKDITSVGPISDKKQKQLAEKWSKRMEVKADSIKVFCNTLSGGNKQKVSFAKWTARGSEVLIMDCPTRGVDIGVKQSMYALIAQMKKEGKAIILISEEMAELIGMADKIIIMKDFRKSGEVMRAPELKETDIIEYMI